MTTPGLQIRISSTPNPSAWKFILNQPVLIEGKATYSSLNEAVHNPLAMSLLQISGVQQVHLFSNVITITHHEDSLFENLKNEIETVIIARMANHDPNQSPIEEKKMSRANLSPELQQIESILDRTIRPGLQGDGGDLEVNKYEDNKLYVTYQGACGTCPSSTSGTLMAIEGILRDEFNPDIEVIPNEYS